MNGTPGNCKAVDGAPKPTGEMGKEVGLLDLAPASFFGGFKQGAVAEQAYGDPRSLAAAQRGGGVTPSSMHGLHRGWCGTRSPRAPGVALVHFQSSGPGAAGTVRACIQELTFGAGGAVYRSEGLPSTAGWRPTGRIRPGLCPASAHGMARPVSRLSQELAGRRRGQGAMGGGETAVRAPT